MVPPLGVLCGEGVLSTCGIGGFSLVVMGLLHCSCEELLLSYFRGLVSICNRGAPLYVHCAGGLYSSFGRRTLSNFGGSLLCLYHLGLLPCDGIGFLSNCGGGFRVPLKL